MGTKNAASVDILRGGRLCTHEPVDLRRIGGLAIAQLSDEAGAPTFEA